MSSEQMEKSVAESAETTKQFGQEKSQQAGSVTADKWGQAKQGTADTAQATANKAGELKDQTGNVFQNAGNKVGETFTNIKNSVTGNK